KWPTVTSDTQAPTAPSNLAATATSSSSVALSWTASTDNVGVAGYRVSRNGTLVATDRKSTRLNSSHDQISYAVFCLKKKRDRGRRGSIARPSRAPSLPNGQLSNDSFPSA